MLKNRYKAEQMMLGAKAELKRENEALDTMYADPTSTAEQRSTQKMKVQDIKDRFEKYRDDLKEIDQEAQNRILNSQMQNANNTDKRVLAKAEMIRATMEQRAMNPEMKALLDDGTTGGDKFLPKTVSEEIITEPFVKNPLRELSTVTSIANLEIPRLDFSLDDDEFIKDGETAKELNAKGTSIQFGRHKFKVFCDVSETTLTGTHTQLVSTVEMGLQSGLAAKEKKIAFATAPSAELKHMSFYTSSIKEVEGVDLYNAIINALGDLEDDYSDEASVSMRKSDYYKMLFQLANGSTTLFAMQPEAVLGIPVKFCDKAVTPVVGAFRYSHFNYAPEMLYDRDKNVKTGMESFVLTAWIDHQIKLTSAFRLAKVVEAPAQTNMLKGDE